MNTYDLNDGVTLSETVQSGGVDVDPATLDLTYTDPDGVETVVHIASLTHVSLGVFAFVVKPTKPGVWSYYWQSTSPQGASSGQFLVLAEPALGQSYYSCKIGLGGLDAVDWVRQKMGDTAAPFVVPDAAYEDYVKGVAQDISRFLPMDALVGDTYANTSPLNTVQGQRRYLCTVANGFAYPVRSVRSVLWRASSGYSAATEIGYMALLPISPMNAFLFTPDLIDTPSMRYLRDAYLNEIDHYGIGQVEVGLDPSGNYYIDLFPIPGNSALPIWVAYDVAHADTGVGGHSTFATIPDRWARIFAKLLQAEVYENEAFALADANSSKAGNLQVVGDVASIVRQGERLRENAYLELGISTPAAEVST